MWLLVRRCRRAAYRTIGVCDLANLLVEWAILSHVAVLAASGVEAPAFKPWWLPSVRLLRRPTVLVFSILASFAVFIFSFRMSLFAFFAKLAFNVKLAFRFVLSVFVFS